MRPRTIAPEPPRARCSAPASTGAPQPVAATAATHVRPMASRDDTRVMRGPGLPTLPRHVLSTQPSRPCLPHRPS